MARRLRRVEGVLAGVVVGLTLYNAAVIAELVRSGVHALPKGQTEAAHALGLRRGATLRLVIVPQAMRVIVPPLTNQYLNLTKNSSLAVAIGYPDLVQIFTGTVLNNTGRLPPSSTMALDVVAIRSTICTLVYFPAAASAFSTITRTRSVSSVVHAVLQTIVTTSGPCIAENTMPSTTIVNSSSLHQSP